MSGPEHEGVGMIEPLYVDEARLDEYYSQVVTEPKVRRVPTYTVSAGLSPSVGLQGAVTQVPVGLAEKLETGLRVPGRSGRPRPDPAEHRRLMGYRVARSRAA
jgi:hypothetical protein